MSKYIPKSKDFLDLISKRIEILVGLVYLYLVQKIAYPINFQQDDVSELKVINFEQFSCAAIQGDNHPLFTNLIWFISRVSKQNIEYIISSLNILITLFSILFLYRLIKKYTNEQIALLTSIIFLSSENLIVYSISIKQYPLEILGSMFFLYLLYEEIIQHSKVINNYKNIVFAILLATASLTLLILLFVTLFLIVMFKRANLKNIMKSLVLFSPSFYFVPNVLDKLNRPSYREYWYDFFVNTSSIDQTLESISFIFNLVMKGYFGFFYYERFAFIYFIFLLLPLFFKDKTSLPAYFIVLIFIFFNFLKLYPLGGGRTDLILFPTLLFLISRSFSVLKLKKQFTTTLIITLFVLIPFINDPYYKIENMTPILEDISTSINNDSAYIIPMNEQKSSFEYYSAILYGSTEITTKNGCKYLVPNVNNYNIFLPETEERWNKTYQTFNSEKLSELYLIGIELDGTQGQIRDAESYLINLGFNKVYEKNYDVGMLLIKYIK